MEIINGERLVLGTCYYPEHWDESLWRDDLRRMLENGIEVIRIAEFAWSKIADREISGSAECQYRWCSLSPWWTASL